MSHDILKVLALDTALFGCSAGLYDTATQECVAAQEPMARGQAEALVPMVRDVVRRAGADFKDIGLIAVTIGPGAFTGLRIGLAAAQGFGIALEKPVVGLGTLDVLAAQFFALQALKEGQLLCVLIETKRQDYYCRYFAADRAPESEPLALTGAEILERGQGRDIVYAGDATGRFNAEAGGMAQVAEGFVLPDPCLMARMALEKLEREGPGKVAPLYLRGADVSKPKKEQRGILKK